MLPELFTEVLPDREIATAKTGSAFDIRKCLYAVASRRADAIILPR